MDFCHILGQGWLACALCPVSGEVERAARFAKFRARRCFLAEGERDGGTEGVMFTGGEGKFGAWSAGSRPGVWRRDDINYAVFFLWTANQNHSILFTSINFFF